MTHSKNVSRIKKPSLDIESRLNEAVRFHRSGQFQKAQEIYNNILEIDPNHPDALNLSGIVANETGHNNKAVTLISKAIRQSPYNPFYHNNLGNTLRELGEFDKAAESFRKALELKPDLIETYNNLGNVLKDLGRLDEAIFSFQQATHRNPDFAEAHYNRSLTLLLDGNYAEGWKEYEWRFKKDRWQTIYPYRFTKPLWDGRIFAGNSLFVHSEQGLGDTLQFVRYLPMVKDLGGTLIFETRKEISGLLQGFPGIDKLVEMSPHGKPVEDFDFYVPLLSLPRIFRTTLSTIPSQVPCLSATAEKAAYWQGLLPDSGFKVGIVWAGKSMHHGVQKRSCSLEDFALLAKIPDVRLIGLQKGEAVLRAGHSSDGMDVIQLGEYFQDLADTAGVIENLDLLITVDTSVAHLAGAMGKPVWTLLSFSPDWRWLLNRDDSPWYPTMRLFRQPEPGNWRAVFRSVAENLMRLVQKREISRDRNVRGKGETRLRSPLFSIEIELNKAVSYHQSGQLHKAQEIYKKILQHVPNHSDSLHLLGLIAHQTGENDRAADLITKAIRILPDDPNYHNSLGLVFKARGDLDEAIVCYSRALELKPDLTEAHNNLGVSLQSQGKADEAIACFRKALVFSPHAPEPYNNMGNALKEQGKYDKAISSYHKALKLKPDYPEAYNNIGAAYQNLNRFKEAISNYQKAIGLRPDYTEAHINMGISYQYCGRLESAISCYQKAIELDPDNADAHFHHSYALLLSGKLQEGWKEYEWRFMRDEWRSVHTYHYNSPRWDGSSFQGKTLFVHAEQGLGDTLQFIRYLPMVKNLGGKVVLETVKPMLNLFRDFPGVDELVPLSSKQPLFSEYELYIPLMSVPGLFRTTLDTIPAEVPYIYAEPQKVEYWRSRLTGTGFNIGIVWAGNPANADDHNRSCNLTSFFPLAQIPNVKLYGLQKGQAAPQPITNLGEELEDFQDTAGVIENLDLVISVDTAVAHLAGAMGKPVWTLLSFAPDWRWLLDREDTPWYPTMRLFRQTEPGNWDSVIQRATTELRALAKTTSHFGAQI